MKSKEELKKEKLESMKKPERPRAFGVRRPLPFGAKSDTFKQGERK